MQAMPFNSNFSPDCGGSQNATNVINTTTMAGTIAMALNIGESRRKFKWNAVKIFSIKIELKYISIKYLTYVNIGFWTAWIILLVTFRRC